MASMERMELAAANKVIERLQSQLAEEKGHTERLASDLSARNQEYADLLEKYLKSSRECDVLRATGVDDLAHRVAETKLELAQKAEAHDDVHERCQALEEEVKRLVTNLAEHKGQLAEVCIQNDNMAVQLRTLTTKLIDAEATADHYKAQNALLAQELRS